MMWRFELHGGAYDGWTGDFNIDPPRVLLVWECPNDPLCGGHATRDPHDPFINLRTVEAYDLVAVDLDERKVDYTERKVDYTVGDGEDDGVERGERELVGAGALGVGDRINAFEAAKRRWDEYVREWGRH